MQSDQSPPFASGWLSLWKMTMKIASVAQRGPALALWTVQRNGIWQRFQDHVDEDGDCSDICGQTHNWSVKRKTWFMARVTPSLGAQTWAFVQGWWTAPDKTRYFVQMLCLFCIPPLGRGGLLYMTNLSGVVESWVRFARKDLTPRRMH